MAAPATARPGGFHAGWGWGLTGDGAYVHE